MNRSRPEPSRPRYWQRPLLLLLALAATAGVALAADLRLQATLIWGGNSSPTNVNSKLADPALSASLRSFTAAQWTNFYEITNLTAVIPLDQTHDFQMNDHCVLKIKNLGSSLVAIDCISHDKQISRGTNPLPLILGSNDTNKTAWFVSLRDLNSSTPDTASQLNKK
jgi:hypothetical protein